jgi:hypothetical protein
MVRGAHQHEILVAQVFNLCTRTGKMPVTPETFQDSHSRAVGPPVKHKKIGGAGFPACAGDSRGRRSYI